MATSSYLTGLSSQAHAHYGLPKLAFSDDPSVLKTEPRRFAIPPTVHTFGADFAESYTMLAALAARLPGGERLALTHAGAAAHHIEDVANQIHSPYDLMSSVREKGSRPGTNVSPMAGYQDPHQWSSYA